MAVEKSDRTTLDMFAAEKRRGRPRTNPLSREQQVRINKRNQMQRDKSKGLKRIEFKVSQTLYNALNDIALDSNLTRGQLIESILLEQVNIDSDHSKSE
ncbi:LexA regulated protein [Ferrimonas lipolytica]|uniref:LexA regulated protein n=1 Tax=Ferrimonas lipolytica TaxID=2724191 RepID=A0A6H1UAR4_9GAMM|nr:LexA regulated protein [Ferrimonas lipolytica]QIZ76155.1 LexA regulated protein [Ferrimonas lipolytica]